MTRDVKKGQRKRGAEAPFDFAPGKLRGSSQYTVASIKYSVASRQKRIAETQVTITQRITNTGCRKVGEYKGMSGGEHKQRSIPMGPDFVQRILDSTMNVEL